MNFLTEATVKLSAIPAQVRDLVRGLSEEQLSWKSAPDVFSMRENLLHLRDIDVEGYARRVRLILDEDCPALPNVDGRKLSQERDYNAQPVHPAMHALFSTREVTVARLKNCSSQDLDRQAEMQGMGIITLRGLLELWMGHDAGHIADMMELRRAIETKEGPSFVQHQAA